MIFFLLRLAVAAILLANGGDSRPGGFKIIGPGGGGAMFHPIISPHDSSTVLVSCDMTGSYITHDAGKSWRMFYPKPSSVKSIKMSSDHSDEDLVAEPNPLGTITAMAIDPSDSKTIYVAAGDRKKGTFALFTSRDGGENWVKEGNLPGLT